MPRDLQDFVQAHGAAVLNTAFPRGYEFAEAWFAPKPQRLRLTLVGLGDVGGTVLTALKLLGREIEEIRIFDFNEKLGRRYCLELNQVLSLDGAAMPKVSLCRGGPAVRTATSSSLRPPRACRRWARSRATSAWPSTRPTGL